MNKEYRNNQEPQIGDRVRLQSDATGPVYVVTSVLGGRMGNKVGVVPEGNQTTCSREYYYYCFVRV